MENFRHGHSEERHGRAVGAQAVCRDLPHAGFHEVADEIGSEHEHRYHQTLIGDIPAHAAGEDAGLRAARAALHDVLLGVFHAERERREAVGHKVDPEQVHRLEDREAQERGDEDADDLAHVRAEQELDGLADVVVNAAAFLDRADDRGKVVVREHHVGHVFRHVRTGDAHADADVGGLDGGRVVHAVAGHGGDVPGVAPGVDDARFVLGLYAGVNGNFLKDLRELLVAHLAELRAGDGAGIVRENAEIARDGNGGVDVVAGDHDRADAGLAAFADRAVDLRTAGVDHAEEADEHEIVLKRFGLVIRRNAVPGAERRAENAQRAVGKLLGMAADVLLIFLRDREDLALVPVAGAALEQHFRRALGVLHGPAVLVVDGGHHFTAGIERRFADAGEFLVQLILVEPEIVRVVDERGLRRLALGGVHAETSLRVAAERHGLGEQDGVVRPCVGDGHAVLRERTGLVRADDLRAAERFDRRQTADDRVAAGHVRNADGKNDRDDRGEALRNGSHGERDRDHKGVENDFKAEAARAQKLHRENDDADAEHEPGEDL